LEYTARNALRQNGYAPALAERCASKIRAASDRIAVMYANLPKS
jgi:hypothetical protein